MRRTIWSIQPGPIKFNGCKGELHAPLEIPAKSVSCVTDEFIQFRYNGDLILADRRMAECLVLEENEDGQVVVVDVG